MGVHVRSEEQRYVPTTMSRNPSPVMSDITGELGRESSRRRLKTIAADNYGDGMQRPNSMQQKNTM